MRIRFLTGIPFTTILVLIYNLLAINLQAQSVGQNTWIVDSAYAVALRQYHIFLAPEPGLFRGSQYVEYDYLMRNGHPFFGENRMRQGSVLYDGVLYENLPLQYDEIKEFLIIDDPYENYKISLINRQVDRFTIEQHLFIHLTDSLNPSQPANGFYEQLYKGRISLLKSEKKTIAEDLSSVEEGVQRDVIGSISYYIKKGELYYSVNNKKSLLHALKDKKGEVKKFMRKNLLNLKKDKENALLKIAAWYDGL